MLITSTVLLSSCSKGNDNEEKEYHFTFNLNGAEVSWPWFQFDISPSPTSTTLDIWGANEIQPVLPFEMLGFTIVYSGPDFPAGTYDTDGFMQATYIKWINGDFSDPTYGTEDDAPSEPPAKYTVIITSINDKEIRGTFQGNYLYDLDNDEILRITDGSFFLPKAP